jgi:CBS domain-containing protein
MQVKDAMTTDLVTAAPDMTVTRAAQMMRDSDIGWLPVVHDGNVLGVVTDRDIITRAGCGDRDPGSTTVKDVMSTDVAWCRSDDSLDEAERIMTQRTVRRLLVTDEHDRPAGVLSIGDLAVRAASRDGAGDVLERISRP